MKKIVLLYSLACIAQPAVAQFAPQAGVAGSSAISKNDARFVDWASGCIVERGWQDIAVPSSGKASLGTDADGTGKADNFIVSLGDSGIAVLTFSGVIYNGPGDDFAVFENGFPDPNNAEEAFLEFAFVEVSSDGVKYVRFPSSSLNGVPQVPAAGVFMNARKVHNLAGKYIGSYGTPFDLEELKGTEGLDVDKITHVRLVDVVGSIGDHGSKDKDGNLINDPYPTAFPSSGFDLDAVGVIHSPGKWPAGIGGAYNEEVMQLYPNPATDIIHIKAGNVSNGVVSIKDVTGRLLLTETMTDSIVKIDVQQLTAGVYYVTLIKGNGKEWTARFTKY